ncbi:hypothetical protein ES332_D02G119800v1 [Gossypium tomentosum]|uniref:Uncharacterized protein n=1 Tax=Gossypium tomentosum TaxID=34277 RepID=A0A5D2LW44_GOSTO|nr:hypothetical protein ES332_D02G119800v1 [Gossypium tomentosum]
MVKSIRNGSVNQKNSAARFSTLKNIHTSQSEAQLTSNQNTQPPVALNPTLIFSISVDSRTRKTKNPQFLFRRSRRVGVSDYQGQAMRSLLKNAPV